MANVYLGADGSDRLVNRGLRELLVFSSYHLSFNTLLLRLYVSDGEGPVEVEDNFVEMGLSFHHCMCSGHRTHVR